MRHIIKYFISCKIISRSYRSTYRSNLDRKRSCNRDMQKARLLTQFSKTTRQVRYSNEILCTAIFVADNTQRAMVAIETL